MKLTKQSLSKSFALTTGILWVLCSGIVALLPDFSRDVTQWWVHGMELSGYNITFGSFALGGATIVASAWLTGYILGWSLQLFSNEVK
ncbi:MAG: hypothetical protein H6799_02970 [Candidatus Nomurabacteria bacterium]|nr:MAG: hypothetical protein H6799_02970 [Candidatus Nomurabacteria bacterium]